MEIGEISLLSIVTAVAPMALFVLLAMFAPLVYRRIAGKLIEKFRPHQPQWISIILDSYLRYLPPCPHSCAERQILIWQKQLIKCPS